MAKRRPNEGTYVSQTNARGKKTRSPGWEAGNHWVYCDRCSSAVRAKDAKKTWDNLIVCPDDWEPRHSQDFVRGLSDDMRAKEPVRPEPADRFITQICDTRSAIAGIAIAGCAIAGMEGGEFGGSTSVPPGTFNPGL
jgi:hypothetical protein